MKPKKDKPVKLPKDVKPADWNRELGEWLEIAKGLK